METILPALGAILLKALPTFFLVILLHFYLKYMFFRPLEDVLRRRFALTEGARAAAEETLARASAKAAEYEAALRAARSEIYQSQEHFQRQLLEEREAGVRKAREEAEAAMRKAKDDLAVDVSRAKQELGGESDALAERIAEGILSRRVA
jgi:F-type H+-transporting ATPase subunit b